MTTPFQSDSRLGLSTTERAALLRAISTKSDASPQAANREHSRFTLPPGFTVVGSLVQPGGSEVRFAVAVRDVSRSGMAMLHNAFVHPGSKCTFVVLDESRSPRAKVKASVVRCTHVRGTIHDVGVKFESHLPVDALASVRPKDAEQGPVSYPALATLADELSSLVRNGADLKFIAQLLADMSAALGAQLKAADAKQAA
ncbi:MAG TPA: PilZ domain-containing protein [Phycisphaerales bacterium]|nr:PilZ domain-containing protein [Phycisphaerales bacterium]